MRTMKHISPIILPLLFVCLFFCASTKAQSAYQGGKGDGYASAEIQNIVLNINPSLPQTQTFNLYPNPAKTSQNLQIVIPESGQYNVEIINLLGQLIFSQAYHSEKINIPLSGYQPGSYMVHIRSNNFNYIQKLVIIAQ